jgi:phosphatidylglycerol:prolipoprotein diacylglycerol transferase
MLATIFWDFPNHIPLFGFELRYYSLMFIISFILGQYGMQYMFKKENINPKLMDSLVYLMIGATIVGARLGHVLFWEWGYYKAHPGEILKVWKGGLASHGAAIAIIVALIFWSRRYAKKNPLWSLDRVVIVVALAGGFIRMGNWFNSEIYGAPANSVFETVFVEDGAQSVIRGFNPKEIQVENIELLPTGNTKTIDGLKMPELDLRLSYSPSDLSSSESVAQLLPTILDNQNPKDRNLRFIEGSVAKVRKSESGWEASIKAYGIPRYPTQLFEAGAYWIIFVILALLYEKRNAGQKQGFLFGMFLVLVFGFRIFIENYKEIQEHFEEGMRLNLGQWLSVPLVAFGLFLIFRARRTT